MVTSRELHSEFCVSVELIKPFSDVLPVVYPNGQAPNMYHNKRKCMY